MAFHSHGSLSFSQEGPILIIEGEGPWNREAIEDSADRAEECHKNLCGRPWGVLAIIHGDPFHTPDAAELLRAIVKEDKKNGRVASALLLDNSSSPGIGSLHIAEIYGRAGEVCRTFSRRDEAVQWLKEMISEAEGKI